MANSTEQPPAILPGAMSALLEELIAPPGGGSRDDSGAGLRPGMRIGRFELVRELGRGGFGVVYEARDGELGRFVALKILRAAPSPGPRHERLLREAEAAARLSHTNIVTLHDIGRGPTGPYLVLELLRGETLGARLQRGRLSVREALRIVTAVARGLAHAHAQGIIHRDLSAGNVFLCEDGQVKILDFGLAHVFGTCRVDGGTTGYMAPEQERGAPEDERTDVFALGVILHRALVGHSSREGTQVATATRARVEIAELPALSDLLETMLATDPVQRPRDAGVVLAVLERLERDISRLPPERSPAVRWPSDGEAHAVSVAVLPFADLSPTRDQEWLCDGLAEEIIHVLAGLGGLRVASRSASFQFKNGTTDTREMARTLGVMTLLEGSVRRAGQRVRIVARLIGADGYDAWSECFDRVLEDAFEVQSEIAQAVARVLQVRVSAAESRRLERVGTRNTRAYEMYLRARRLWPVACSSVARVRPLLHEAIALDPSFAEAHAALADADCFVLQWHTAATDPAALRAEALAASETALRLDPMLAEAHVAHGNVLAVTRRNADAENAYRKAIALNPGLAAAWYYYARFLLTTGRPAEAAEPAEHAAERDPENVGPLGLLSLVYRRLGDADRERVASERGRVAAERRLHLDPDDIGAMTFLANCAIELGDRARGIALLARAVELEPDNFGVLYNGACGYAKAGDPEHALDLLDRALTRGRGFRGWIENDSDLDTLRARPRFQTILERLRSSDP